MNQVFNANNKAKVARDGRDHGVDRKSFLE
jgi:hypothetical protein